MPSMHAVDKRISKLDDKSLEVMQIDTQNKKKKVKKMEHRIQDL